MVRDESCRALQRATALASARCLAASAQAQLRGSDSSVSWRWNANQFRSAPRASFASLFPHNSICSSAGSAQRTQRRNTADCALSARGSPQASPSRNLWNHLVSQACARVVLHHAGGSALPPPLFSCHPAPESEPAFLGCPRTARTHERRFRKTSEPWPAPARKGVSFCDRAAWARGGRTPHPRVQFSMRWCPSACSVSLGLPGRPRNGCSTSRQLQPHPPVCPAPSAPGGPTLVHGRQCIDSP